MQTIDDLETGDEIHFSNGDVWSCTEKMCGSVVHLGIFIVKGTFKDVRKGKLSGLVDDELRCSDSLEPILADALAGGAKIVKGVGLVKPHRKK